MATKKPVKDRVKGKLKNAKKTVKGKCKACSCAVLGAFLSILCGCASSEPASRVTSATYGDIELTVREASNITIRLTLGDGAMSSSDSAGSTETNSANPTNAPDIKPDLDVNVGGASGSGLGSAISSGIKAICGSGEGTTTTSTTSCSDCSDGSCVYNQ